MREMTQEMITECYKCVHRRNVPGNCHIKCANPMDGMVGDPHGIANGWFIYPMLFDPTWKRVMCTNFKEQ